MILNVNKTLHLICFSLLILTVQPVLLAASRDQSLVIDRTENGLTLERVMADPDWMGNAPQNGYFSDDGKSIIYSQKIKGSKEYQRWSIDLSSNKKLKITDKDLYTLDNPNGPLSPNGSLKVFNNQGDLWLKYLATGELRQLTRTIANEGQPQFIGNNKVAYKLGNAIYSININSGLINQLVDLQFSDDPEADSGKDTYLVKQQSRYFDYIKQKQQDQQQLKNKQATMAAESNLDAPKSWFFGEKAELHTFRLSPNGRYLLVGTYPKVKQLGKPDNMPRFVTEDGFVKNDNVRSLVGSYKPRNETLYLLDLEKHSKQKVNYSKLPLIGNDPLAEIKRATAKRNNIEYKPLEGDRGVAVFDWIANEGVSWSADSSKVAVMLYSDDNKDRWIVSIDSQTSRLKNMHHLRDEAWVNDWDFNDFGWLKDNKTLYFNSEESGFSHLYLTDGKKTEALTKGRFIVNDITLTNDKKSLFYRANKKHPGIYEVYKVDLSNKKTQPVTDLGGLNSYKLSIDDSQMLITHSEATKPDELYWKSLNSNARATQITQSQSELFKSVDWVTPEFIEVSSSEEDQPIHARLYKPKDFDATKANQYPAVIFIHGAGYLQNAHQGWSGYFREFMFHTFLTQQGYIVLDMDFRASKGYGRDWRTAIYRKMGTPEVVDLQDGAEWLSKNANVDREKIGIYGGSYGGFLTFMALFTEPNVFAAGAALRPVTDWAHYNHGYTSNILNTPETDPEAFEKSSPIEFAEGLNKPLLIAHGMVDDNVFFKDTVRLVQRLIELEKTEYFETAMYPIEAHGFTEPSSWLDEYKRIYYLFEENLK